MDNVQNCDSYIDIISSQNYRAVVIIRKMQVFHEP
jgi:hypothetical protein